MYIYFNMNRRITGVRKTPNFQVIVVISTIVMSFHLSKASLLNEWNVYKFYNNREVFNSYLCVNKFLTLNRSIHTCEATMIC